MLEIKITVDNINYDSAIDMLYPAIADKLEERLAEKNPVAGAFGKLVNRTQDLNKTVFKGILSHMSEEKKEELIAWCVNSKPTEISRMLTEMFKKKNLTFNVRQLEVEQKDHI